MAPSMSAEKPLPGAMRTDTKVPLAPHRIADLLLRRHHRRRVPTALSLIHYLNLKTTDDVLSIRVRNSSGEAVPLGSFTTVRSISGPYRVPRYNLYPSAELDGAAAPGYSQGQAMQIMEKLAAEIGSDWARMSVTVKSR